MKIEIYTTDTCGFCKQAKEFFRKNSLDFIEHNVTQDREKAMEIFKLSGQMGVPMIVIDKEVIVGFDIRKIKKLIDG
jgi:glutaredoxin-like YruB-family protein